MLERKPFDWLLFFITLLFAYFFWSQFILDGYIKQGDLEIYKPWDQAIVGIASSDKNVSVAAKVSADCYQAASKDHIAGFHEFNVLWPPSWYEQVNKHYGRDCK
jgi:uncharacterized SAM-binding protein YcdF (DUF218 family)